MTILQFRKGQHVTSIHFDDLHLTGHMQKAHGLHALSIRVATVAYKKALYVTLYEGASGGGWLPMARILPSPGLVSSPDPTSKEEKGLVNLGRILGPALGNFHVPIKSQLWLKSHDKLTAGM